MPSPVELYSIAGPYLGWTGAAVGFLVGFIIWWTTDDRQAFASNFILVPMCTLGGVGLFMIAPLIMVVVCPILAFVWGMDKLKRTLKKKLKGDNK